MIITLTLIIGGSACLIASATSGVVGYLIGTNRRRQRQIDERYDELLNYIATNGTESTDDVLL